MLQAVGLKLLLLLLSITFLSSFCNGRFPTIVIPALNNTSTDSYKNKTSFNNNNPKHQNDVIKEDSIKDQREQQQHYDESDVNDIKFDDNRNNSPKTSRQSKIKKNKKYSCPEYCLQEEQQQQQQDYTTDRTTNTNEVKEEEQITSKSIRIFYFILVHNNQTAYDAIHLYHSIRHPNNIVLFHIDTKVSSTLYQSFLLNEKCSHLHNSTTSTTAASNSSGNNVTINEQHILHPLWDEVCSCTCGMKIQIESIYSMEWSKWSMTVPTLYAINIATTTYKNQWTTFINLSGDTIPVYTPTVLQKKLLSLYPYNFVTSSSCSTGLVPTNVYTFPKWWHKRRHYTYDDTVVDPTFVYTTYNTTLQKNITTNNITISTYFGSQWVILQYTFCDWLNNQLNTTNSWPNQYKDYLISSNRLMSDETYIPTILMHSTEFQHTIPKVALSDDSNENDNDDDDDVDNSQNDDDNDYVLVYYNGTKSNTIRHVRYERMDENVPTAFGKFFKQQRYAVSSTYTSNSNSTTGTINDDRIEISIPRPWGPYYLGVYDLYNIKRSGALFIRKVSYYVDPNIQQLLPVSDEHTIPNINWPTNTNTEIVLSTKPNWDKWINAMHDFNKQKKESTTKTNTTVNNTIPNNTTVNCTIRNDNEEKNENVNSNENSDIIVSAKNEDNSTPTTTDDDNDTYNSNNNDDFITSETVDTTTVRTTITTRRIDKQMKKTVYVPVPTRYSIHDTTNEIKKKNDNEEDEEEL